MKHILTTMLLLVAMAASAQSSKDTDIKERFFQARVDELSQRLEMTSEQKVKFAPVYRRYSEEMRAVWGPHKKGKKHEKTLTPEQQLQRTKQRMERQQQAQAIRMKFIDEFATVLTAQQVSRFYEAENKIQKKLMERRRHHRTSQNDNKKD